MGRKTGHVAALFGAGQEVASGGTSAAVGVAGAPETAGLSLGLTAAGAALVTHGVFTIKNAAINLMNGNGEDNGNPNPEPQNNNGKNEKHGDSKAISKAAEQVKDLKEKIGNAVGKEKKKLQQTLINVQRTAQKNA
ncbi:hypothetical protein A0256_20760 [Mucilaginibacter sp. PAMC 26640]|nr:hypothetical protein A0256_20760 [Mucilaginibacter sp. PAMC 26640]